MPGKYTVSTLQRRYPKVTIRQQESEISVLGAFEAVQHRAEFKITRLFVLFEGLGFAGECCDASGEAGAAPGGEDAPAEEPVGAFEVLIYFFFI